MNAAEATTLYDLFDSLEGVSGIYLRSEHVQFICEPGDEPSPVYLELASRDGRYFLGVRFPLGIVIADGWATPMWGDGVPADIIDAAAAWLRARAL